MSEASKVRVTITLSKDLLEQVDKKSGSSRSAFIERCLRQAMRRQAEELIARDTIAYYNALTEEDRAEDAALSAALSRAARRLDIGGERKQAAKSARSGRKRARKR